MTWVVLDALIAALIIRWAAPVLDETTIALTGVIVVAAIVWNFVRNI